MQFNSSVFVFAFLPITLICYHLLPWRSMRNAVLLLASLAFYAWGDPSHVLMLLVLVASNFALVLLMDHANASLKRLLLALDIVSNVALLAVFKYSSFAISNINSLFGSTIPVPDVILPLGISYFTIKLITYAVDVFRGSAPAQDNPIYLALFVAMFPTITAGPITKYSDIYLQLESRAFCFRQLSSGMRLFCLGMVKKVLLSNNVAILASSMLSAGGESVGAIGAWGGLLAYAFQLYFDFSGYSDMAIGVSRMFGFELDKNFNYPYIARSVTEFWRRWHISLSTFFREYIYIPMGGSRVSTPRFIVNMGTVWLLTGIWHGASWNFIWWGLYYLLALLVEKFVLARVLAKAPSPVCHLYVTLVYLIGWCIFWISDTNQLVTYLRALFGAYGLFGRMTLWQIGVWQYVPLLLVCAFASTPLLPLLKTNFERTLAGRNLSLHADGVGIKDVSASSLGCHPQVTGSVVVHRVSAVCLTACDLALLSAFVVSLVSIVSGSFSPVIYATF